MTGAGLLPSAMRSPERASIQSHARILSRMFSSPEIDMSSPQYTGEDEEGCRKSQTSGRSASCAAGGPPCLTRQESGIDEFVRSCGASKRMAHTRGGVRPSDDGKGWSYRFSSLAPPGENFALGKSS